MQVKLILAKDKEFKNDKGEIVKGKTLVFLNELAGETLKYFVNDENLKGYDPKFLCTVKGKDVEISTTAKTYQGKTRVVLDNIIELAE